MIKTTRAQRVALKRVYDRCPVYGPNARGRDATPHAEYTAPLSYRAFRRMVQGGWDCVMVQWCGMWLGIELDGYTHS